MTAEGQSLEQPNALGLLSLFFSATREAYATTGGVSRSFEIPCDTSVLRTSFDSKSGKVSRFTTGNPSIGAV
jgi:hypothetical protein